MWHVDMAFGELVKLKATRSQDTARQYEVASRAWCAANGFESPEKGIEKIKSRPDPELAGIESINRLITTLSEKKRAPKTITGYVSSIKKYLAYEDVLISSERFHAKTVLPRNYEVSIDTAPTDEQMKQILFNSSLKTKALIMLMASSGLRIGEVQKLKIGHLAFDKNPVRVTIPARTTKTKTSRFTFISDECANLLKNYLGDRIKDANAYLLTDRKGTGQAYKGGLIDLVERSIKRANLRYKLDESSARYALHGHSLRKLFFTRCLAAGIDRGICEAWMGHRFALDGSYLRLGEDKIAEEYLKVMPKLTWLSTVNGATNGRMKTLEEENKELKDRIGKLESTIESMKQMVNLAIGRLETKTR